jgi:hypothetical protein
MKQCNYFEHLWTYQKDVEWLLREICVAIIGQNGAKLIIVQKNSCNLNWFYGKKLGITLEEFGFWSSTCCSFFFKKTHARVISMCFDGENKWWNLVFNFYLCFPFQIALNFAFSLL